MDPADDSKSKRPNHWHACKKLEELLSQTIDLGAIIDDLIALRVGGLPVVQKPTMGFKSSHRSSASKLVSYVLFSFAKLLMGSALQEPTIWAILIGIDNYPAAPLQCAAANANAVSKFLTNRLDVPPQNIIKLVARLGEDRQSPHYPT